MSPRKPYEPPTVTDRRSLATRLHGVLYANCDATRTEEDLPAQWYGPHAVLREITRAVVKELDFETRLKFEPPHALCPADVACPTCDARCCESVKAQGESPDVVEDALILSARAVRARQDP